MVTIKVPVGTNGWMNEGWVQINGKIYTFPVGVETQVPESVVHQINEIVQDSINNQPPVMKPPYGSVATDKTLTVDGAAADAKVTGDRLATLSEEIEELKGEGGGTDKTVKVVFGSCVDDSTGEIRTSTDMWCTGYVATAGYEKVEYYGRLWGSILLAFYDADKTFMKNESIKGPSGALSFAGGTVDVPSGAAYAAVTSYGIDASTGGAGYLRLFNEGGSGMAGLEYTVTDLMGKVNPLKGKRFAVLGDSISSVNYTLPVWWQLIAEKYGCEFVNYGVSGSRIAVTSEETGKSFTERYVAMDDTVDGVVVVGGTNDSWYTPIGAFNSEDNTTLNGALNEMLPGLLNKYPGKPVLFFAPIQREDYTENDYPVTVADLKTLDVNATIGRDRINLAIMVKCRQYGVPCVDLYASCGINGNDANSVYFRTDDNLHPSAMGMQRIAGVVTAEMVKHFMFVD